MKKVLLLLILAFLSGKNFAQPLVNEADILRGSLNENRDWFDIKRYVIDVTPNYDAKSIVGVVSWKAIAVKPSKQIQIDLQTPLVIDSIFLWSNTKESSTPTRLEFKRSNNIALAQIEKHYGPQPIVLSAQAHLQDFYKKHNFVPDGAIYLEDGIPHIHMIKH